DVALAATDPSTVRVDAPDDLVLTVDPELTRRALGFLVDNATKYGHEATVAVTADGAIEVRDRGPGIPDDVKESLFELFTRGRATTTVLRVRAGLQQPDRGSVALTPPNATVGYLPQEPERRSGETVRAFFARRTGVTAAAAELEAATTTIAEDHDRYDVALER